MLVISRCIEQSFLIGDDILVSIREINRGQVRIGIQAPNNINIVRCELLPKDHIYHEVRGSQGRIEHPEIRVARHPFMRDHAPKDRR